jgi:hypothetical protein
MQDKFELAVLIMRVVVFQGLHTTCFGALATFQG